MTVNVICSAVSFGLGPVGKLCSIVEACPDINWFLCGDKIDEFVFERNVFSDKLFTRDYNKIKRYINDNDINVALVVLDGELALVYKDLGLKVIYVDSLGFMWQDSDVLNGDVPLNVDYYCVQDNFVNEISEVLKRANNLVTVNPILPIKKFKKNKCLYDVIINFGGLNIGGDISEAYIDSILPSLLKILKYMDYKVLITCGSEAKKYIQKKYNNHNINIENLNHNVFLNYVFNCKKIITTPGLTTILEIASMNKDTVVLPPNNLSQFYNQNIAQKILKSYKIINWGINELSFEYLKDNLKYGEEKVVELIQDNIKKYGNNINIPSNLLDDSFNINNEFKTIKNGTLQIKRIIYSFYKNYNSIAIDEFIKRKKYVNKEYFFVPYVGRDTFSKNVQKIKKARDYMIYDILKIDDHKDNSIKEFNLGHGDPARNFPLKSIIYNVNKIFNTQALSKYNSALGSNKKELLDFINSQGILFDNNKYININNIIPTNSVTHGFDLVLKSICKEHDVVLFTSPCYGLFTYMPERIGAETRFVKLKKEDGYIINPIEIKKTIISINKELREKYKDLDYIPRVVAFVNENPHNPIGYVLTKKDLNLIKKLNKVCYDLGTFIIDDLVYQGTEYNNELALPCAIFPKYFNNVITLYGTSKTFCIPGVRAGFVVANEKVIYEIRNQMFYSIDSYSLLNEQILTSIFNSNTYKDEEHIKFLDNNVNLYRYNYNYIKSICDKDDNLLSLIPEIDVNSGFFAIINFSGYKNKKYKKYLIRSEKDLLCFLYEYGNIRFITGEAMCWPDSEQLIGRITYSINTEDLKIALNNLVDTLSLLR